MHELRRHIVGSLGGGKAATPLVVKVMSFGFRGGVPSDADLVFDVRFLPNPHFVSSLRRWTGRHVRVARYVLRSPAARTFLRLTNGAAAVPDPAVHRRGQDLLTIAIGCTGGRHRSVAIAEALAARLRRIRGVDVRVRHRDVSEARGGAGVTESGSVVGVVVITHGKLATELLNAAEMIVGDCPGSPRCRSAGTTMSASRTSSSAKAIAKVDGGGGVLLLTDMFGGTPSNLAIAFLDAGRVEVVTGVNLPMLIKLAKATAASDLLTLARDLARARARGHPRRVRPAARRPRSVVARGVE